jgi:Flp pilus assembly protein TadB
MAAGDIDSVIAAGEKKLQQGEQSLQNLVSRQQADDRSYIAKLIVLSFVILMAFVVIAVVGGTLYFCDWNKIVEPAKFLMTVLGSVMLPVVTLVIGYYFGSK